MSLNKILYRLKYRFAPYLHLTKPVDVSLELASTCNLACKYCYHSDEKNLPFKKGFMHLETAYKIINSCAMIEVNSLKFNYRGESTLHPNFYSIVYRAKELAKGSRFIDRITNSNFNFMTIKENIFEGLACQTKVKVSFDSFIPEVMEKQRVKSNHALVLKNIDYFYNHPHRIKSETELVIQSVRTLLNKDEDLEGQIKRRWPEAKYSIRDMVTGRVNADLSSLESKSRNIENRKTCLQAHNRLIFNWDGKAQVCCPDISSKIIVGDINNESVYEIFNSVKAKNIRIDLKNKEAFLYNPCRNCSSFESYDGYKHPWNS